MNTSTKSEDPRAATPGSSEPIAPREERGSDIMTQTNDVPLPAGASPSDEGWDGPYRVVYGVEHKIVDSDAYVQTSAVQLRDGSLDTKDGPSRSEPGISVHSHWENYLTAPQARQLAAAIIASADELDVWQSGRHRCQFDWCTTGPAECDEHEHWSGVTYVRASLRHGDPYHIPGDKDALTVGTGLMYTEGELPAVIIHLDGGVFSYDCDAFLRLDEAAEFLRLLSAAVTIGRQAHEHQVDAVYEAIDGSQR